MRDRYLYKAKRTDNGEWVTGNLVDSPDGRNAISETSGDWKLHEVDTSTICQCTGRDDEWEHDIFICEGEAYEIMFDEDSLVWIAVSVFSPESIYLGEFGRKDYVRVGNAIDNPELLEVGE